MQDLIDALRQLLAVQGCDGLSNAELQRLAAEGHAFYAAVLEARRVVALQALTEGHWQTIRWIASLYAQENPKFIYNGVEQDPLGVHALCEALAARAR